MDFIKIEINFDEIHDVLQISNEPSETSVSNN